MGNTDRKLVAHLARRSGFGATVDELDRYVTMGYEDLVDYFLEPSDTSYVDEDLLYRRHPVSYTHLTLPTKA